MAIQLFQTTDVEEQWESVLEPWLRAQSSLAWRNARPTVILTPGRAESFYLRSRWVAEKKSFLGLRFWIPNDARKFLMEEAPLGIELANQADLRLAARACAEELVRSPQEQDPSWASVAREPGPFLRTYDLLLGAGWNPGKEGPVYGRQLARKVEQALEERRVGTQAGIHSLLRQQGSQRPDPLLANLIIVGFNASHWPLWDLLKAMAVSAENTTVSLLAPRYFGEKVDQLWISSWEEIAGSSIEFPVESTGEHKGSFSAWIDSYEKGVEGDVSTCDITFRAAGELSTQIQAIVLQTLEYLKRESCDRLGIVFPEPNALSLGVADHLQRLGISLDDGTGFLAPGIFERRPWRSWLRLQGEPSVQSLIGWVRACEAAEMPFAVDQGPLTAHDVATTLDRALGDSLIDQLDFLALKEADSTSAVATFLRHRLQLPERATVAEFLTATGRALQMLGWIDYLSALETLSADWLRQSSWLISRRTFLEWLRESTDSKTKTRAKEGNHFYGKVHLLIYPQMPGQTWSHLILTGLNEGRWPRTHETTGAFCSRHEWMELNRQARRLNRLGVTEGGQGMGHDVMLEDHGYCLLPLEQQDLALRDLCAALSGTRSSVCLTAMTSEMGRALLPSDFFTHAYHAKTGRVLDEAVFSALAKSTAETCARQTALLRQPTHAKNSSASSLEATRLAYAARRNAELPFGAYEFSYAQPPREPIQLPCKTWEQAWNHPASIWLERVVGVSPWPEGHLAWPRAVGTWVHRWLTTSLRACTERQTVGDFLSLLREAVDQEPARIRDLARLANVELYPWWQHVCAQARAIALTLGEDLMPHLQDRSFLSEFRLPKGLNISLLESGPADFELKGRLDLLLVEPVSPALDPTSRILDDCSCWVIDFKTGSSGSLTEKKLEKGFGLQTVLYALAVREAGAVSIAISLHTCDATLKPQVQIEQVMAHTGLLRSLDKMHRAGVFGQRADAENEYGFAPGYPLATRLIPAEILQAKWVLTHGGAALWEEQP